VADRVKSIMPRSALLPFVLLMGMTTNVLGVLVVGLQHGVIESRAIGVTLVLVAVGVAFLLRAWRVPTFWPYLALAGTISWWALYWLGVHPALAFLPLVPLLPHEPRRLDLFASPPDDDSVHHFEHEWNHLVQIILFCFGLVNAGVLLEGYGTGSTAVLLGALLGRPTGILIAVGVAVAAGLHLPSRVGWRHILVAALATSSGFAFGLFYTSGLLPLGSVRQQITLGALGTVAGAAITLVVARVLGVVRDARPSATALTSDRRNGAVDRRSHGILPQERRVNG
jgi:Na+:H+ antiporter, NhaA family